MSITYESIFSDEQWAVWKQSLEEESQLPKEDFLSLMDSVKARVQNIASTYLTSNTNVSDEKFAWNLPQQVEVHVKTHIESVLRVISATKQLFFVDHGDTFRLSPIPNAFNYISEEEMLFLQEWECQKSTICTKLQEEIDKLPSWAKNAIDIQFERLHIDEIETEYDPSQAKEVAELINKLAVGIGYLEANPNAKPFIIVPALGIEDLKVLSINEAAIEIGRRAGKHVELGHTLVFGDGFPMYLPYIYLSQTKPNREDMTSHLEDSFDHDELESEIKKILETKDSDPRFHETLKGGMLKFLQERSLEELLFLISEEPEKKQFLSICFEAIMLQMFDHSEALDDTDIRTKMLLKPYLKNTHFFMGKTLPYSLKELLDGEDELERFR